MKIYSAAITNRGKKRSNNEDNYYLNGYYRDELDKDECYSVDEVDDKSFVYAVCDGVGGIDAGELASLGAVMAISEYDQQGGDSLSQCAMYANEKICEEIENRNNSKMGSTFVALKIEEGNWLNPFTASICNVGDSRAYLFRDNELVQLSKDHSRTQVMVEAGMMTEEEAKTSKLRHVITQCLGRDPASGELTPYNNSVKKVKKNDLFLLCSDGLTEMIEDYEIQLIIGENLGKSPLEISQALLEQALDNGGKDNVTILIVKVGE